MDIYTLNINNNPYEVKILSIDKEIAEVEVNKVKYTVDVSEMSDIIPKKIKPKPIQIPRTANTIQTPSISSANPIPGSNDIVAPMPGQIIKIYISEGDEIKAGDVIIKIESMKMENEIKSTMDGTVKKIHLKEGGAATEGAILVSLR